MPFLRRRRVVVPAAVVAVAVGLLASIGAGSAASSAAVAPRSHSGVSARVSGAERPHDLEHGTGSRLDQARLAHHLGEQVLRRHLHGAESERLPVEDPACSGRPAHPLLRDRALEHGQLPVDDLRPGALGGRAGRLLHERHPAQHERRHRVGRRIADEGTPTTASSSPREDPTPLSATTAARSRPTSRPCSTS